MSGLPGGVAERRLDPAMAIWKLTIEDDEGQKTVVPLVRDEYSIGRRDGHAIRLTERNVSRDHAKIKKNGEGYVIEDLGSYNGVFVNGHRVAEPTAIHTGDLIIIGDYRIEAHDEQAGARPAVAAALASKVPTQPPPVQKTQMAIRVEKPNRLVVLSGTEPGAEYPLDKPKMIIGRGDDVDLRINHSSVSRHHAEVIALGEGRFEVIDQGSANGLRLNGQDVKRAMIGAGDLIELGDVQVKYVGAGQTFVFDAAAAEAVREVELRNERARKKSGAWTWGIVVVLVAGAAAGGVILARGSGGDRTTTTSSASGKSTATADDPMAQAMAKFAAGDPIAAYESIKGDPTARSSPDFVKIANGWAAKRLEQLKDEPDADTKKQGLQEIEASAAEDKYRDAAAEMLASMEAPVPTATATETMTVAQVDSGKKPPATATTTPTVKPPPTTTTTAKPPPTTTTTVATTTTKPTTTTTAPTPTVGNCPSYKGDYSVAAKNSDWDCVRTMLLPRLNAGAISSGEARYLKAACTQLGDLSCAKRAAEKI